MASKYLAEAFQSLRELEEDIFDLNAEGTAELKDFVSNDETDELENIIDPLATTEEDLQSSYVGKVILDCTICQSKIYKDASEVVVSEDNELVNVGDECPYCQNADGYKIIGEVAPYSKTEVDVEVTPKEDGSEEANIDLTSEDDKKEESCKDDKCEKPLEESMSVDDIAKAIGDGDSDKGYDRVIDAIQRLLKKHKTWDACLNALVNTLYSLYDITEEEARNIGEYQLGHYEDELDESLKEDLNGVTVDTDKETINITATEKAEEGEEMIAPIEPETEAEFQSDEAPVEDDKYADFEIDEFEESDFDGLGESYLKRVYENVAGYKTVSGSVNGNTIKLEGIITFKSGKKAKTNFVFEAKTATKTGKLKFLGENKQFAKGKNAFTLTGSLNGSKLIAESLTYNYRAKDGKTGNSKRLYGTVKR